MSEPRPDYDAMWQRIRAKLPVYLAAPCMANGHDWSDWSPYSRGVHARSGFEIVAVETGERRHCETCAETQYRAVFFDAPMVEGEPQVWE